VVNRATSQEQAMRGRPTTFRGEVLIDGYNVLHAAGLARRSYGPGEFERTRRRLLKLLAGQLLPHERQRTTVVFDAPEHSLGPSPPTLIHGIRVIFAGGEGDADDLIERLIQSNTAPRRLHVVSSDRRIQRAARRRRAKFFSSEEFLDRILRRRGPDERARLAEPPEKQQGLTAPGEIEAWMQAFGDISPAPDDLPSPPRHDKPTQPTKKKPPTDARPSQPDRQTGPSGKHRRRSDPLPAERSEVAFWEQRIAQLWEQTDDQRASPEE
jgi:uncharacterized protein